MLKYWKDLRFLPRPVWIVARLAARQPRGLDGALVSDPVSDQRPGVLGRETPVSSSFSTASARSSRPPRRASRRQWGAVPLMRGSLFLSGAMLLRLSLGQLSPRDRGGDVLLAILTEAFRPAAMSFIAETSSRPTASRRSPCTAWRSTSGWRSAPPSAGFWRRSSFRYLFFADGATSIAAGLVLAAAAMPGRGREAARPAGGPTRTGRVRLSTAAHADPRFLFFLAAVLPVTHHLLPAHLLDAALHRP